VFCRRISLLAFAIWLAIPVAAEASDLYFMIVYGAQRPIINQPRYSHTWATFVKLSGEGADPRKYAARSITISWLPQTLEVRPLWVVAEPGVNLTHARTVAWCDQNGMEISQFGPYQIEPRLWELAYQRFQKMAEGEVMYRASDLLNRPGREPEVCNCIYAVLDLDGRDPAFRPVTLGFGEIGSAFVVRRLSQYIVCRKQTHPWVSEMVGACTYETPPIKGFLAK
jgi:hypothetical protein